MHGFELPLAFRIQHLETPLWLCVRIGTAFKRAYRITFDPKSDGLRKMLITQPSAATEVADRFIFIDGHPERVIRTAVKGVAAYFMHTDGEPHLFQKHTMNAIREAGYSIVAVNNSNKNVERFTAAMRPLADAVLCRENMGRDFGAFADFMRLYGNTFSGTPFVFLNDSLIGPAFPLHGILESCAVSDAHLIALTDSYEEGYHLQSSFLYFKGDLVRDPCLMSFFATYDYPIEKSAVIREGEIGLSRFAQQNGLRLHSLISYPDAAQLALSRAMKRLIRLEQLAPAHAEGILPAGDSGSHHLGSLRAIQHMKSWYQTLISDLVEGTPRNPQHAFWDILIEAFGYPFLKRELITSNPQGVPCLSNCHKAFPAEGKMNEAIVEALRTFGFRAPFISEEIFEGIYA